MNLPLYKSVRIRYYYRKYSVSELQIHYIDERLNYHQMTNTCHNCSEWTYFYFYVNLRCFTFLMFPLAFQDFNDFYSQ